MLPAPVDYAIHYICVFVYACVCIHGGDLEL